MDPGIKKMIAWAVGVTSLGIIDVMAIAVLGGFKGTLLVDNTTVDLFITGLTVFGTFIGIIVLAIVGKIIIGLFQGEDMGY